MSGRRGRRAATWMCWWCCRKVTARTLPRGWQELLVDGPSGSRVAIAACSEPCAAAELRLPGLRLVARRHSDRLEVA